VILAGQRCRRCLSRLRYSLRLEFLEEALFGAVRVGAGAIKGEFVFDGDPDRAATENSFPRPAAGFLLAVIR
jgi:hypothetical protein